MHHAQKCVLTSPLQRGAAGSTALQSPLGLLSLRPLSHKLPEGHGDSALDVQRGRMKLRWGMVLPSDASVFSHVFWKDFRKLLNQQAFKFLRRKMYTVKQLCLWPITQVKDYSHPYSPLKEQNLLCPHANPCSIAA